MLKWDGMLEVGYDWLDRQRLENASEWSYLWCYWFPVFQIARLFLVSDILFNSSAKVPNASFFRRWWELYFSNSKQDWNMQLSSHWFDKNIISFCTFVVFNISYETYLRMFMKPMLELMEGWKQNNSRYMQASVIQGGGSCRLIANFQVCKVKFYKTPNVQLHQSLRPHVLKGHSF